MYFTYSIFKSWEKKVPDYLKTNVHQTNLFFKCVFVAIVPLYIDYNYKIGSFFTFLYKPLEGKH